MAERIITIPCDIWYAKDGRSFKSGSPSDRKASWYSAAEYNMAYERDCSSLSILGLVMSPWMNKVERVQTLTVCNSALNRMNIIMVYNYLAGAITDMIDHELPPKYTRHDE